MLAEDETIRLYYHMDNSKEYHNQEPNFLEIEAEDAPLVELLIQKYPQYVKVEKLFVCKEDSKQRTIAVVQDLYDRGLLLTEQ